ncbi:hypothetical protein ABZ622_31335 [Streptomyces sp. NPDC007164]
MHVVDDDAVPPGGDDDESDEIDAAFPGEEIEVVPGEDDYYADVWETR